jgi:hypothetical protein
VKPLPTNDLRQNVATLAIPEEGLPGVGALMRRLLPSEEYDPEFKGQFLQTTYFDTACLCLRKARINKEDYCTVRIRCYAPTQAPGINYPEGVYALSIKTANGKFRVPLDPTTAETAFVPGSFLDAVGDLIPGDLLAKLYSLTGEDALQPCVTVCFTRYAVESTTDRLTLDCGITASDGKAYPCSVLEVKTTIKPYTVPDEIQAYRFSPIKLSKFLWATTIGVR